MQDSQAQIHTHLIREAIRKIALGRALERVEMSPGGTSGVGTARMIHGYVAKVHNDPSDEEWAEYAGTIDVREFPDETAATEPVTHKGVLLAGVKDNSGGFLIIPTLFSDVTIVTDAATRYAYVLNFSHADFIQLQAHKETSIGVTETEELELEDNNSPDYNEVQPTGNKTASRYSAGKIVTTAVDKNGKSAVIIVTPDKISQEIDKTALNQSADKIEMKAGNTAISISDSKVTLGNDQASEPLVLGNQLAQLMLDFLTECSKITTPTLMGTMPAINAPNFAALTAKIQNFLSKTSYTE